MKSSRRSALLFAVLVGVLGLGAAGENVPSYVKLAPSVFRYYLALTGVNPHDLDFHSIGHSHIDAAWKWRMAETHHKVNRTFTLAVEHMDEHPGYTFSQSSPQYYEWTLEDDPALFARIQEKVKQGRWELVGGMWVEPDCNLPSGESFVRQRLIGQRFYLEHFGKIAHIAWLPDSFGYNRNLPQIFARSGAKYLWAKKINTNFDTVFPFQQFHYRSPDGSSLLTTLNPAAVGAEMIPWQSFLNLKKTRYLLKPGVSLTADYSTPPAVIQDALSDDWLPVIADFYGEGDGHQGPTEFEIEMQELLIGKGYTRFTTAGEFFADLEPYAERFPVWTDELYLERHRGVQTTHGAVKRANRESESDLFAAETISSVLSRLGGTYPGKLLTRIWKRLCLLQFHDILPGSSIPEVYEDAGADFAWIKTETRKLVDRGLAELAARVKVEPPEPGLDPVLVFNDLTWERSGLVAVKVPAKTAYAVEDQAGAPVPCQERFREDGKELLFRAEQVPSVGYKLYYLAPAVTPPPLATGLQVKEDGGSIVLENRLVKVTVDQTEGLIRSLWDKGTQTELIAGSGNRLLAFTDRSKQHRAWNIDPGYLKKPIALPERAEVRLGATGPLFAEIIISRKLERDGAVTTFVQTVRLVDEDPVVYLDLDSDFHLDNALVKLEFNTPLETDVISADGAYLVVDRPTHPKTAAEKARWEMAGQKWIGLSNGMAGLALLNKGKYGFSLTPDGRGFRQSLIKAAEYPEAYADAENVAHYPKGGLPYTDQGRHHIELGLLSHAFTWRERGLWRDGLAFNQPLEVVRTEAHGGSLPAAGSFITVRADSSYLASIKQAEDDDSLVLRLVEMTGKPDRARVDFGQGLTVKAAWVTDLLELNPAALPAAGSSLEVDLAPYEIKTVKVRVEQERI